MAGIDKYLLHAFESAADAANLEAFGADRAEEPTLPMLLRLKRSGEVGWLEEIPGCRVTSALGDVVACRGTIEATNAIASDPRVISIEASRPGAVRECAQSIPFVRADVVQADPTNPENGEKALVAVIDGGIDVFHHAFRDASGQTRIHAVWDQTDPTGPAPVIAGRAAYGTLHTRADINGYLAANAAPPSFPRDPGRHGTHVTSIAAGGPTAHFFRGVAPAATLLIVIPKLDAGPNDPMSIGYSNSHVDALTFIDDVADTLDLPVVVNVSQGMNAGAHDGSSTLEAAFDNFSGGGRLPGRVVVKSAGNERAHAGHAKLHMSTNGADEFTWRSTINHRGSDVIELWFRASDQLRFRLVDPNNQASPWIRADESADNLSFGSGLKYSISYDKYHWDNGDSRVLVTISRGQLFSIPTGDWKLEIEADEVRSDGTVHAWLERDNTRPIQFTNHLDEEVTLSIPGTAHTVIAVGSVSSATPIKVAPFSSFGPTRDRREKPDLGAPGIAIQAALAGTDDKIDPQSGTSMAAPHVAGAVALALSRQEKKRLANPPGSVRQFNAAQIRAALRQSCMNFSGHANPSMGYGALDVKRFLEVLA
jgi:subtilisin family serine protease